MVAAGLFACSQKPAACARVDTCGAGYECLANRCVPYGGDPVSADSERLVRLPTEIRVLGSTNGDGVPPTVTFGDATDDQTLYLAFSAPPSGFALEAAFLLLEPTSVAEPASADVVIRVTSVSFQEPSDDAASTTAGVARSGSTSPLRIDVTALARSQSARASTMLRFALTAAGPVPSGVTYQTGAAGELPVLELYGHTQRPARAVSATPTAEHLQ